LNFLLKNFASSKIVCTFAFEKRPRLEKWIFGIDWNPLVSKCRREALLADKA